MTRLNQTLTSALVAIYLFLSIAAGQTATGPTSARPLSVSQPQPSHPFLWKVEGSTPSWLFGTIHSDDSSVASIPPLVVTNLERSKSFHPEIEASAELGPEVGAIMFGSDGPDLATKLPPPLWIRTKKAGDALGLPEPLLQRLSPGLAALLFSAPPNTDIASTVDGQLHDLAVNRGLTIAPLETVEEQLSLFEKLPDPQAIAALTDALNELDAGRPAEKKLLAAYASGDEQKVTSVVASEFAASSAARALAEPLLYHRNQLMADRLAPHLKTGGAFVAVGVAHLTGPRSLIEILRARGWRITRVP